MKTLLIIGSIIIFVLFLLWLGLSIKPSAFPPLATSAGSIETIPLLAGLPVPVERYYRVFYGKEIPVITSVVMDGRAQLRPAGPFYLPSRFRFTHVAGQDYRHYIESTIFGIPFLKINERYVAGQARMELPFGTEEGGTLNQAANLGLWAETNWFPAVFLTDPRVKWLPLDDETAILNVPFGNESQNFIVRFNPATGYVDWMESMRYQNSNSQEKTLWLNKTEDLVIVNGRVVSQTGSAIWMNDGKPWAYFTLENIIFNADLGEYILQKGL